MEKNVKILITGGEGYIGKSLSDNLRPYYKVTSISRNDFDLIDSSETKKYFLKKYFDVVIHCAVKGGSRLKKETWKDLDDNLRMYYNLLSCSKNFGRLIHFGSGAEISSPESPYGLSKKIISRSISEIDNFYNLRIYAVFDHNELETRFIKNNITKYLNKKSIEVWENKIMSFFYMEDLVTLVKFYIDSFSPPKEVNCVYPESYTLSQISEVINFLGDHRVEIILSPVDSEIVYSGEFNDLGLDFIGLHKGIKKVYDELKLKNYNG